MNGTNNPGTEAPSAPPVPQEEAPNLANISDEMIDFIGGGEETAPPAPTPVAAPAPTPVAPKPQLPAAQPPAAPAQVPQLPTPQAQPQPQPVSQPPVAPTPQPAVQPPAQPVTAQQPSPAPLTPEQQRVQFSEARAKAIADISKQFTFTEEEVQLLNTDPEKVMPRLAAQATVDAYLTARAMVMRELPQMILAVTEGARKDSEAREGFFKKFPALNSPQYHQHLGRIYDTVKAMNPGLSSDKLLDLVGAQAHFLFGLPLDTGAAAAMPQAPTPVAPQPPAPPVPKPFAPAAPGGSVPVAPSGGQNFFEQFANEIEDLGSRY